MADTRPRNRYAHMKEIEREMEPERPPYVIENVTLIVKVKFGHERRSLGEKKSAAVPLRVNSLLKKSKRKVLFKFKLEFNFKDDDHLSFSLLWPCILRSTCS